MEMNKVFISGPVSGIQFGECAKSFWDAEKKLANAGFSVFNPIIFADLPGKGFSEADVMAMCITALGRCTHIYQLDGWENSDGAVTEWNYAKKCGIIPINHSWLNWYEEERWKRCNGDLLYEKAKELRENGTRIEDVCKKLGMDASEVRKLYGVMDEEEESFNDYPCGTCAFENAPADYEPCATCDYLDCKEK